MHPIKALLSLFLFAPALLLGQPYGLMPDVAQQYFTANGQPLAGGFIATCQAGASCPGTPLASYTDSTGVTANPQLVPLDGTGKARIWLNSSLLYKIVVLDSNMVVVKTVDNVSAISGSGGTSTNYWTLNGSTISNNNSAGAGDVSVGANFNVGSNLLLSGSLKLRDTEPAPHYAIIRAPVFVGTLSGSTLTPADVTWRWPASDAAGCIVSDGMGNLSFSTACGGGGGGGGGGAAGPNLSLQYNNAGALAGTINAEVDANGNLSIGGTGGGTSVLAINGSGVNAGLNIPFTGAKSQSIQSVGGITLNLATADTAGLLVNQAATPSVDAIRVSNSTPTTIFKVDSAGLVTAPNHIGTNLTTNITFQNTDSTKFNITGAGTATVTNLTVAGITGMAQCLQVNTSGVVSGSGGTCGAGGGGAPGAPTTSVQFNSGGVFTGSANFEWDNTNQILSVGKGVSITGATTNTTINTVGGITAALTSPTTVGLTVQGAAVQTGNLAQFQNSSAVVLANVDASGNINGQTVTAGVTLRSPALQITGITGPVQCLHVNGVGVVSGTGMDCGTGSGGGTPAGPTSAIQFNNAGIFGGTGNATVDANGNLSIGGSGSVLTINGTTGGVNVTNDTQFNSIQTVGGFFSNQGTNGPGLIIRAHAGQSVNVAEFQNSASGIIASVGASGGITGQSYVSTASGSAITFQNQTPNFTVDATGALIASSLKDTAITGTQCLHAIAGVITGTGTDCGAGGGGSAVGPANAIQTTNGSGTFLGTSNGTLDANGNAFLNAIYLGGQHGYASIVGDGTVAPTLLVQGTNAQPDVLLRVTQGGNKVFEVQQGNAASIKIYDGSGSAGAQCSGANGLCWYIDGPATGGANGRLEGLRALWPFSFANMVAVGSKSATGLFAPLLEINGSFYYVQLFQ